MSIEREKEQMERENKDLMLKLYQFKEQMRKSEKGEALIVFTVEATLCCGFWTCDIILLINHFEALRTTRFIMNHAYTPRRLQ